MDEQSTRHLLMIEPAEFFANPETMDTNAYQVEDQGLTKDEIYQKALNEFRGFRDALVTEGVIVTTVRGYEGCPDMVFPNWSSTHRDGKLILYPMMNENRRAERDPAVIEMLRKSYPEVIDLTAKEREGIFLEARGSIVCDRVNKVAYVGRSPRTNSALAVEWAEMMDYELEMFDTMSHSGQSVYHTDLVMWIGTTIAGICSECIASHEQERVVERLRRTHTVVEFSMTQLKYFCGNALEVRGSDDRRMLALSSAAHKALSPEQKAVMEDHFAKLIHAPLDTLELYGGGSARCTLQELY